MGKALIAYYSRRGKNHVNGRIVDLKVGNTEKAATIIRTLSGADLFYIDTVKSYPEDYYETTSVAKLELKNNTRPELTEQVESMEVFEVIYLGYPNWWGTFPMAVFTFLESYDFSGKTIYPFCTHEGSGLGRSINDIKKLCPDALVKEGLAIHGSSVAQAKKSIETWLNK